MLPRGNVFPQPLAERPHVTKRAPLFHAGMPQSFDRHAAVVASPRPIAVEATGRNVHAIESRVATALDEQLTPTLVNLRAASEELPQTSASLRRTMRSVDLLVTGRQEDLEGLVRNLRSMAAALRDVAETARKYPSQVLFGSPPPRARVGR